MNESMEPKMGQYAVLRRTNMEKVSQVTGYSLEDCEVIMARAESKGKDRIRVPIIPGVMRNAG